uniref:Reverse transcriptase domain-containing protein n=1 Tax=Anolis carolinensis TaxID=28377 RepID=A0A803T202_ANOCA
MENQTQTKSILARSSPRIKRTAVDVADSGHPSTSGLWNHQNPNEQSQKRQKYTMPENRTIMKCYYKSEPQRRGYQKRMYQLWKQEYPDSQITEPRLADQRRFIIRNKVFSEVELEEIQKICKVDYHQTTAQTAAETPATLGMVEQIEPEESVELLQEFEEPALETSVEPPGTLTARQQELKDKIMAHAAANAIRQRLPTLKTVPKRHLAPLMKDVNAALSTVQITSIEQTNQFAYSAAVIVTEELGLLQPRQPQRKSIGKPKWKVRLELKIKKLRSDASNLKNMKERKLKNDKIKQYLIQKYWLNTRKIEEALEIVKEQITATARKIERYEARIIQYRQNQLFQSDQRRFYQSLNQTTDTVTIKPEKTATTKFWKELWENNKNYNKNAGWIKEFEGKFSQNKMELMEITTEMISKRVQKVKNWTSPGSDQLHGFWLKHLISLHGKMAQQFNEMLQKGSISEWLTTGRTYLIQKDPTKGAAPGNYRPITCLPTMFKLLAGIIADRIQDYLEEKNILPDEQKGNKWKSRGTKDQLLIDKMILENCKSRKANLHMTWIDYKKAFDSLPHSWIIKCLDAIGICKTVGTFIENMMEHWKTELFVGNESYGLVNIRRGIFQGDSLSPLLFIIAMIPLSTILQKTNLGYQISKNSHKISHLMYMDDLKLYGKTETEIQSLTNTVRIFSTDINMEFGLDKCSTVVLKKGKIIESEGINMPNGQTIKCHQPEAYKYLGILQLDNIKHEHVKTVVSKEYTQRVRKILKSKLNGGNTIKAINTWAIPVIRYTAGIINWTQMELDNLDRKTRKLMTIHHSLHPRSDVDRLYLPRRSGGRGLLQVKQAVKEEEHALAEYVKQSEEPALIEVKNQKLLKTQQTKNQYKKTALQTRADSWHNKTLHGKFLDKIEGKADKEKTWLWLTNGTLKKETEGLILAAQEQAIRTNAIKAKIEKSADDPKCRLCKETDETIDHILSCCKKIAQTDYKQRHNYVAQMIHWNLCLKYHLPAAKNWWDHKPAKVLENEHAKILWDFRIQTDKVLEHNTPDITVVEKNKVWIIDVAIPGDSRIDEKQQEKLSRYQDLKIELQRLWQKPVQVVPVVMGTLGAVPKDLSRHLETIDIDKITICQLQKATLLGSAHIIRKYITQS